MNTNEQAPDSCPFCGEGIIVNRDEELIDFKCGNAWQKQWPEFRGLQSMQCITAERERLTRERDVFNMQAKTLAVKVDQLTANLNQSMLELDQALMLLGVYKTKSGDLLARVKRLEEAGDAVLWYFRPKDTGDISFLQSEAIKQWTKAKEATP